MDPIPDLTTLRNLVSALKSRGLIVGLTPEGRGHVLTHALYQPGEMEKLRAEYRGGAQADHPSSEAAAVPRGIASPVASQAAVHAPADRRPQTVASPATAASDRTASDRAVNELAGTVATLRSEVDDLRSELDRLRREVDDLLAQLR